MDTFRHRTPAKLALGGPLEPLFGQFQDEVHISGLQAAGRITIIPDLVRMQAVTSVQQPCGNAARVLRAAGVWKESGRLSGL
jgi:hypothetical protein